MKSPLGEDPRSLPQQILPETNTKAPREENLRYWEGYYDAQRLISDRQRLPRFDPNDDSSYARGFKQGVVMACRWAQAIEDAADAKAVAKLLQAYRNAWDTLTNWLTFIGSSRTLGKNLEKAGNPRPVDHAQHHIVAENDLRAERARQILDNFGVKIDDIENGVWLPHRPAAGKGAYHPQLHTDKYYLEVEALLEQATSRGHAIEILKDIGQKLANGTFLK